jgi:hypothetical protein
VAAFDRHAHARRVDQQLRHAEVVAVSERKVEGDDEGNRRQHAAVFVPDGEVSYFLTRLEKYALTTAKADGERRHENLYDRVADLRLATVRALWTDDRATYPRDDGEQLWWEVLAASNRW